MKKKKEEFFYKNLCACVEVAGEAASMLKETVQEYDESRLQEKLDAMHELEQKGDAKHHKMMSALSQAFITPLSGRIWWRSATIWMTSRMRWRMSCWSYT